MFNSKRWRTRIAAQAAGGLLVAGGLTAIVAMPAQADTTTGGGTAPVVSGTTATFSITPDQDGSDAPLEFAATVGDVNSMENLTTVTLCLGLTGGGDTSCAAPDGRVSVKMTWTQSDNSFAVDDGAGTLAADAASISGYSIDAISQNMTFKLTFGEALREGSWESTVTALDDDGLSHSVNDTDGNTVNWYANVDTQRSAVTWGAIAAGDASTQTGQFATIVTNGTSAINYSMADLTDGSFTATNAGGADGTGSASGAAPGNDAFALDCDDDGGAFSANGALRIGTGATLCEDNVTTSGTAEGGDTTVTQSLKLFVGTEWKRDASPLYTGAVAVTVTNS